MRTHTREIIGFLCRWCLLGMIGAVVVFVGWYSATATLAVAQDVFADVVLPDAIVRHRNYNFIRGYYWPEPQQTHFPLLLCVWPKEELSANAISRKGFVVYLPHGRPDTHYVWTKGIPYGTMAFRENSAIARVVSPQQQVFLVDARIAKRMSGSNGDVRDKFDALLETLQRAGQLVFFDTGPFSDYTAVRRELRRQYTDTPVLARSPYSSSPVNTLLLARSGLWGRRFVAITDDGELAKAAAKRKIPVHWVASPGQKTPGPKGIRIHESLSACRQHFAAGTTSP